MVPSSARAHSRVALDASHLELIGSAQADAPTASGPVVEEVQYGEGGLS